MDELEFLRSVEQDVQLIRSYLPNDSPVTASNLATTLKIKLNGRIIELLEEKTNANQRRDTGRNPQH